MITLRLRSLIWFGAGVAVCLAMVVATMAWRAYALPGPAESTIVSVTPSRVLDTRTDIGLPGPFTSAVSQKLQITGNIATSTGAAVVVPVGATGVLMNVTAVNPPAPGFVSIRPGDATGVPSTSSLNVERGVTVPNSVQVALPTSGADAGKIDITFDAYGQAGPAVDILVDVVGYTTNAGVLDLVAELATKAPTSALPISSAARENDALDPDGTSRVLVSTTIVAPTAGVIHIVASTEVDNNSVATEAASCQLTIGAGVVTSNPGAGLNDTGRFETVPASALVGCSTNGALAVGPGTHVLNLVGLAPLGVDIDDATIEAVFYPGAGPVTAT